MVAKELKEFSFVPAKSVADVVQKLTAFAELVVNGMVAIEMKLEEVKAKENDALGDGGDVQGWVRAEMSNLRNEMTTKIAAITEKVEEAPQTKEKKSYAEAVGKLEKKVDQLRSQVKRQEVKVEADVYAGSAVLAGVKEGEGDSLVTAVKGAIPRLNNVFFRARRLGMKREDGTPRPILITPTGSDVFSAHMEEIREELPENLTIRRFTPANLMEAEVQLAKEGRRLNPEKKPGVYFQIRGLRLRAVNGDVISRKRFDPKSKKVVDSDEEVAAFDGYFARV